MNVSAIVNCHTEGHLAWRAFRSALAALELVPGSNELLLVLDAPDDATRDVARRFADAYSVPDRRIRVLEGEERDLGEARNLAIGEAKGKYSAFLDADDVWGKHWLVRAFEQAEKDDAVSTVYHPQLIVNFEMNTLWWQHADSRSAEFDPSVFFITNHWTAHCFARTTFFDSVPYHAVGGGFGFEDWEWNMRTLEMGSIHAVVPETVHFIRKTAGSMSGMHSSQGRIPRPNKFFERRIGVEPKEVPALSVGEWLVGEWKAAHDIEPELWPNPRELVSRAHYSPPRAQAVYDVYHRIHAVIPKDATHVVFFAGLGGGADLRVEKYADAIVDAGGKPALIATDAKSRGFAAHDTIEVASALGSLDNESRIRVVQRLMVQLKWRGAKLHIVNSSVAWHAMAQNTAVFNGEVFASLYAYEHHPHGQLGGYVANGAFGAAMKGVRAVVTDNDAFRRELAARMGWSNTVVAPTPVTSTVTPVRKKDEGHPIRVLVAGRVDWNKNLDLVFAIATHCLTAGERIMFDVVGDSSDYHGYTALAKLKMLPNVKLRPGFGSFGQLKPDAFDVFLFTSRNEGMPNTVLEAMTYGLPVVASPAGGLADCAVSEWPGRIVKGEDPEEWVRHIKQSARAGLNPALWLRKRHTKALFEAGLASAGYFDGLARGKVSPQPAGQEARPQGQQDAPSDAQPSAQA